MMTRSMFRATLAVSAVALIPATTAAISSVDAATYREFDALISVFERVRSEYVEKVDQGRD
jgi:carboxyl-terminal processing protease